MSNDQPPPPPQQPSSTPTPTVRNFKSRRRPPPKSSPYGLIVAISVAALVACCALFCVLNRGNFEEHSRKEHAKEQAAAQNRLAAIKQYEAKLARRWIDAGRPELKYSDFRVGAVGSVSSVKISQIIDSQTALATMSGNDGISSEFFFVKGYGLSNRVDGDSIYLPLAEVTGTQRYTTVLGAPKQVYVLQRVPPPFTEE